MRSRLVSSLLVAAALAASPGCFYYRWGTPDGVVLPTATAPTDLVVHIEDPTVADVCERVGVFGRVDQALDPWPASGVTPHAPDAWLEVVVEPGEPDLAQRVSFVYSVITILPFALTFGHACPAVVVRNERLILTARAGRSDDPWVRGEEVERIEVPYREGEVLYGVIAMACRWEPPAPTEILEGALRLMAERLTARRARVAAVGEAAARR